MTKISDRCVRFAGLVEGIVMYDGGVSDSLKIEMLKKEIKRLDEDIEKITQQITIEMLQEE